MVKEWYKSKTIWFGALYVLISLAGVFGFVQFSPSADLVEIVGGVTGVLVIVLRLLTKEPVI